MKILLGYPTLILNLYANDPDAQIRSQAYLKHILKALTNNFMKSILSIFKFVI